MAKYSWSCAEALTLVGVQFNPHKTDVYIECPFCNNGKRFCMDLQKDTGRCFKCNTGADSASYVAAKMGIGLNDARNYIKKELNLHPVTQSGIYTVQKELPQEEMADAETLNKTYSEFLNLLTLSDKNRNELMARGFSADDIASCGYKTFPQEDRYDFKSICRKLLERGCTLKGVPGFYKDFSGDWSFLKKKAGIIVPYRDINNNIVGFQVRKDDDARITKESGKLEEKYDWFTSKGWNHGTKAKASVHYTDFKYNPEKGKYEPVIHGGVLTLTEGGMKADLCYSLLDGKASIIAVPGVHCVNTLREELTQLKEYGLTTLNLAFDMDYLTNDSVKNAMNGIETLVKELGLNFRSMMNWETKIPEDSSVTLKGLDDYLAYEYRKIIPHVVERKTN